MRLALLLLLTGSIAGCAMDDEYLAPPPPPAMMGGSVGSPSGICYPASYAPAAPQTQEPPR